LVLIAYIQKKCKTPGFFFACCTFHERSLSTQRATPKMAFGLVFFLPRIVPEAKLAVVLGDQRVVSFPFRIFRIFGVLRLHTCSVRKGRLFGVTETPFEARYAHGVIAPGVLHACRDIETNGAFYFGAHGQRPTKDGAPHAQPFFPFWARCFAQRVVATPKLGL
jgi:hypothetical protein